MKNKSEKLYIYLSETDDDLLREAEETDTREKLLSENKPEQVPVRSKPRRFKVRKVIPAIAACAAFAFLVYLILPSGGNAGHEASTIGENVSQEASLSDENAGPEASPFGQETSAIEENVSREAPPEVIKIDSLDALNYYGAKILSARSMENSPTKQSVFDPDDRTGETTTEDAPDVSAPESIREVRYDGEKGYYYYEFDQNDTFTISCVRGFSIRLSNPNGFLARKLGTGLIDVVLTSNSFEDMITFRSRDGKYFSCLSSDYKEGYLQYLDSKYVDGFRIVKKDFISEGTNSYEFSVRIVNGTPVGFESSYYLDELTGAEIPLDEAEFVENSGYDVNCEESFTLAELEKLANSLQTKEN